MLMLQALSLGAWFLYPRSKRIFLDQAEQLVQKSQRFTHDLPPLSKQLASELSKYESSLIGAAFTSLAILGCVCLMPAWALFLSSSQLLTMRMIQYVFCADFIGTVLLARDELAAAHHRFFNSPETIAFMIEDTLIANDENALRSPAIALSSIYLIKAGMILFSLAVCNIFGGNSLIEDYVETVLIIVGAIHASSDVSPSISFLQRAARAIGESFQLILMPILLSCALGLDLISIVIAYQSSVLVVFAMAVLLVECFPDSGVEIIKNVLAANCRVQTQLDTLTKSLFSAIGNIFIFVYDLGIMAVLSMSNRFEKYCPHTISHACEEVLQAESLKPSSKHNLTPFAKKLPIFTVRFIATCQARNTLSQAVQHSTAMLNHFASTPTPVIPLSS